MIYKILRAGEMAAFAATGSTAGGADDLADGFVHFSTAAQLAVTAAKHFAGERDLWLVACSPATMGAALRWEPSRGGARFPHLYRPLGRGDVVWVRPLPLGEEGHVLPRGLP